MKTLKSLFAIAIIGTTSLTGTVQADELMDTIYPENADLFQYKDSIVSSEQAKIVSLGDTSGEKVWSTEYEQYVNPDDFKKTTFADINEYMEANPTASGSNREPVFKWNENAGDYQLN